jgi:hypothetical protein
MSLLKNGVVGNYAQLEKASFNAVHMNIRWAVQWPAERSIFFIPVCER